MKPAPALLALAALLCAQPAPAADVYASIAAWNDDATTLGFQIDAFDKCRDHLAEKHRLGACLLMWDDAYMRHARMDTYARARLELAERSKALGTKLDEATAFLKPEVRSLGRTKVRKLAASDKAAAKYRKTLDEMLKD